MRQVTCILTVLVICADGVVRKSGNHISISGTSREDAAFCVKQYASNLDNVRSGLGGFIRTHPLAAVSTSDKQVIIGAGSGNTGTHSVYSALTSLGLTSWHAAKSKTWDGRRAEIKRCLHYKPQRGRVSDMYKGCQHHLRKMNYTQLLEGADAVVDMPTAEVFLDMFLSFPKAKVVLSTRPPSSWVEGRLRTHPGVSPPMQEPCGLNMKDFAEDELARLYSLNNAFVRCLVPKEQLLEFDLWADPEARIAGLMHELAEFVGRKAEVAPLPYIIPGATAAFATSNGGVLSNGVNNAHATNSTSMQSCQTWLEDNMEGGFVDFSRLRQVMDVVCDTDLSEF